MVQSSRNYAVFFAFGLDTGFTTFLATFFAALTWTGRCFRGAATLALRRFAADLCFGLAASAFSAFSSCQRLR